MAIYTYKHQIRNLEATSLVEKFMIEELETNACTNICKSTVCGDSNRYCACIIQISSYGNDIMRINFRTEHTFLFHHHYHLHLQFFCFPSQVIFPAKKLTKITKSLIDRNWLICTTVHPSPSYVATSSYPSLPSGWNDLVPMTNHWR